MQYKVGSRALLITLAASLAGCALDPGPDEPAPEAVESSQSAIEHGALVNDGSDPVAAAFPLSTVGLDSPSGHCTGVIIAPRLVLTAAHCTPSNTTTVSLYGTTGNTPTGTPIAVNAAIPWTSIATNFADLSIVITATAMYTSSGPQRAVALGASGTFTNGWRAPSWEVGTGRINDVAGSNPTRKMMWVPATIGTPLDWGGSFKTARSVGDHGDSGGPIYQKVGLGPDGLPQLILVGILSKGTAADADPSWDMFTSVESPANYNWIQQMIASAASNGGGNPIRPPMPGTHFTFPIEKDPLPPDAGFGRLLPRRTELVPED